MERTLAQRQSELRTRTHEVEELTVKLSEARKKVGAMEGEVNQVKSDRLRENTELKKLLQEKVRFTNDFAMVFWGTTTKFYSCQYFQCMVLFNLMSLLRQKFNIILCSQKF